MRKLALAAVMLLFVSTAFAWPPIPRAIASGKGIRIIEDKLPVAFIWFIGISRTKNQNVYVLLPIHNSDSYCQRFESAGIGVILRDDESVLIKITFNTDNKDCRQITYAAIKKLISADPNLKFDLDHVFYNPRP